MQNKYHLQLARMQQRGKALVDWGSKATATQTVAWLEGDDAWNTTTLGVEAPALAGHSMASDLHADVSSAAVGIYTSSAGLNQGICLSYVSEELGISFLTPIAIGIDNAAAVVCSNGTVKCSKICHIDARQDWVQAMRDRDVRKLWKVGTLENESDLLTTTRKPG